MTEAPRMIDSTNKLFKERYEKECLRVNGFMKWLMIAQWFAGIAFAAFYSPLTWIGNHFEIHVHVWAAILIGGSLSGFAILWLHIYPKASHSRHVVATTQMLWSALLIHLSGGRIETHFHVFASLAILSIYRDWTILITATVVVAVDHFVRGVFYPLSAFGIVTESPYRWIEHALWVLFEVAFLAPGCRRLRNEIRELCMRQTEIAEAKRSVDLKVESLVNNVPGAFFRRPIEDGSRVLFISKAIESIAGYTPEEFVRSDTLSITSIIHTDDAQRVNREIRRAIENRDTYEVEYRIINRSGETKWVWERGQCVKSDNDEAPFVVDSILFDVSDRVRAELQNKRLQQEIVDASRQAGMAEVATGVLHNVGNVLNSVNVSASIIKKQYSHSAIRNLEKATELISQYESTFADFVRNDDRGMKLPKYIMVVSKTLRNEQDAIGREFDDLTKNIDHIKEIIAVQQTMAKSSGLHQTLHAGELIRDVIAANKESLVNHDIRLVQDLAKPDPTFVSDKHRILQILINLVRNAKDSLVESGTPEATLTLCTFVEHDNVCFQVADNGLGIDQQKLSKVFQHGFTTKRYGHGFGLHSSANAATEVGGRLSASSAGTGKGAEFTLRIPIHRRPRDTADTEASVRSGATRSTPQESGEVA